MAAYQDHPARRRASAVSVAENLPQEIDQWCSKIPAEEKGVYPIDQSDGGEDDDPEEHAQWAAKLESMGRNPQMPWKKQSDLITIDPAKDYISDRGDEVWNILAQRGIKNVILTGVHTNMCVLGRPFGLRQMARNGKNVVLMRDMTDTMYNPQRWPYVSHFTGTDLIISHIEKFVCPTITSDQFLGGEPFRFTGDRRPHVVMVIAEDEYATEETLPSFASSELGNDFQVSYVFAREDQRNDLPGIEILETADVALLSVRRRVLPPEQMTVIRNYIESGKPVLGIRTSSHAFALRNQSPPEALQDWPEFDAQVFGGNYSNHHGNSLKSLVQVVPKNHPLTAGLGSEPYRQGGSLYKTSPLADGAELLLIGRIEGLPKEPVAWTYQRQDGGKSFYTSLGHRDDFQSERKYLPRLLSNALRWAAGLPIDEAADAIGSARQRDHWTFVSIPASDDSFAKEVHDAEQHPAGSLWCRSTVRLPADWSEGQLHVQLKGEGKRSAAIDVQAWLNGHRLRPINEERGAFAIPSEAAVAGDANLLVVRLRHEPADAGRHDSLLRSIEKIQLIDSAKARAGSLEGKWQIRTGDNDDWKNMPLPAKFGTPTDIVYQPF